MVLALFAFWCTLPARWIYLYFDVLLLLVAATLRESQYVGYSHRPHVAAHLLRCLPGILLVVAFCSDPCPRVNRRRLQPRPPLPLQWVLALMSVTRIYTFWLWANGTRAVLLVPARSRHDATILHLTCEPFCRSAG